MPRDGVSFQYYYTRSRERTHLRGKKGLLLFRGERERPSRHPLDCEARERNLGVRKKKQAHEHESERARFPFKI